MDRDISGQVAEYRGLVEHLARQIVRTRAARDVRAEVDDLVQEGLIFVWQSLERGLTPAKEQAANRMKDWVKLLANQTNRGASEHVPYSALLPLDDFRGLVAG